MLSLIRHYWFLAVSGFKTEMHQTKQYEKYILTCSSREPHQGDIYFMYKKKIAKEEAEEMTGEIINNIYSCNYNRLFFKKKNSLLIW